jgi:hypothetical protein
MLVNQGNQIKTDSAAFPLSFYWVAGSFYIEFGSDNFSALSAAEARQVMNFLKEGLDEHERR